MQSKRNLAVAIGLIFASLSGAAVAAPTLYGELDVSVDYLPENNRAGTPDRDVVEVSSNSSFIGVKGDEALTDRLSAVYAAEWTINTDGDGTDLGQRNRFVGLKDKQLGTLKVGKNDTPVKQLSSVVDTFNNYTGNKADIGGIFTGENRIDNVVIYESPALDIASGKLNVTALLATGEASGIAKSSGGAKVAGRGLGDAWSASVVYANPTFVAGLGYDKAIPSNFAGRGFLNASAPETANGVVFAAANTVRAIGRLNVVDGLALKALYQTSDVEDVQGNDAGAANIDKADGWLLGGEYTLPQAKAWTLKAQYSQNSTSYKVVTADYDAKQIIAGVDYAFSKQAKAYGYGGYLTLEQAGNKDKQPVLGAGLEYKF